MNKRQERKIQKKKIEDLKELGRDLKKAAKDFLVMIRDKKYWREFRRGL